MKREEGHAQSLALIFLLSISIKVTTQNVTLIEDYLNYSHIQTALFVTCENINDISRIVTQLHNINSYVNVWSIKEESDVSRLNYTQFFVRLESQQTIVINLNCEFINNFLNQSSQRRLFHLERTWLIFSSNTSQSYEILERENINMDADITLLIPQNTRFIISN